MPCRRQRRQAWGLVTCDDLDLGQWSAQMWHLSYSGFRVDGTGPQVWWFDVDPHLFRTSWGATAIEPLKPVDFVDSLTPRLKHWARLACVRQTRAKRCTRFLGKKDTDEELPKSAATVEPSGESHVPCDEMTRFRELVRILSSSGQTGPTWPNVVKPEVTSWSCSTFGP